MTTTALRLVDEPPTVRSHVARLLAATDIGSVVNASSPAGWMRSDGTPLTAAERELVGSANRLELLAGREILEKQAEKAKADGADMNRVAELTEPYFMKLGEGSTMGQVEKIMPEAERAELIELLDRLAPKSTDEAIRDLIAEAGQELADNITIGYTVGYEHDLARRLITGWDDAGREAMFEFLVFDKMDRLLAYDCKIDEDDESQDVAAGMAMLLMAEVRRRDYVFETLHELAEAAIVRESKHVLAFA